jgi:predicted DNA-binding transcriptional regulator AlpA
MPREADDLLTKRELAEALRVSVRTVERMHAAGTGPQAIQLPSGRLRWRWGDVRRWMEEHRAGGGG